MFGGLIEVTKESSELFSFDMETSTWTLLKSKEMDQSQGQESQGLDRMPGPDTFSDLDSLEKLERESARSRASALVQQDEENKQSTKKRPPRSALPGGKHTQANASISVHSRSRHTLMTTHTELNKNKLQQLVSEYTKSCRAIVTNQRRPSNPKPGPIPAPLSAVECRIRQRGARRNLTINTTITEPELNNQNLSTVNVSSLVAHSGRHGRL